MTNDVKGRAERLAALNNGVKTGKYKNQLHTVSIPRRLDTFTQFLLDDVEAAVKAKEMTISDRLDVLAAVGKWILIKNRVYDKVVPEGHELDGFRNRIQSHPAGSQERYGADRDTRASGGRTSRQHGSYQAFKSGVDPHDLDGDGGPELDAIKASLPGSDDGDFDSNRNDAGGSLHPDVERDRGVLAGVHGGEPGDDSGPDRGGNL